MFIENRRLQELAKTELGRSDLMFQNKASYYSNHLESLISRFETESVNKQFGYRFIQDCLSTNRDSNPVNPGTGKPCTGYTGVWKILSKKGHQHRH